MSLDNSFSFEDQEVTTRSKKNNISDSQAILQQQYQDQKNELKYIFFADYLESLGENKKTLSKILEGQMKKKVLIKDHKTHFQSTNKQNKGKDSGNQSNVSFSQVASPSLNLNKSGIQISEFLDNSQLQSKQNQQNKQNIIQLQQKDNKENSNNQPSSRNDSKASNTNNFPEKQPTINNINSQKLGQNQQNSFQQLPPPITHSSIASSHIHNNYQAQQSLQIPLMNHQHTLSQVQEEMNENESSQKKQIQTTTNRTSQLQSQKHCLHGHAHGNSILTQQKLQLNAQSLHNILTQQYNQRNFQKQSIFMMSSIKISNGGIEPLNQQQQQQQQSKRMDTVETEGSKNDMKTQTSNFQQQSQLQSQKLKSRAGSQFQQQQHLPTTGGGSSLQQSQHLQPQQQQQLPVISNFQSGANTDRKHNKSFMSNDTNYKYDGVSHNDVKEVSQRTIDNIKILFNIINNEQKCVELLQNLIKQNIILQKIYFHSYNSNPKLNMKQTSQQVQAKLYKCAVRQFRHARSAMMGGGLLPKIINVEAVKDLQRLNFELEQLCHNRIMRQVNYFRQNSIEKITNYAYLRRYYLNKIKGSTQKREDLVKLLEELESTKLILNNMKPSYNLMPNIKIFIKSVGYGYDPADKNKLEVLENIEEVTRELKMLVSELEI